MIPPTDRPLRPRRSLQPPKLGLHSRRKARAQTPEPAQQATETVAMYTSLTLALRLVPIPRVNALHPRRQP
ncbi:hypothetical protein PAPYR_7981 [Paratrimastix pyriformis]|uniref:Uncharacterized protein n=1 Tax=Paratrimastix pyriformis TaxID=342808 RepID=A0ABQ8UEY3_9EUKA|nr:hypothetical protein PAPYR_7981 [Paratrimastix pyriformis]